MPQTVIKCEKCGREYRTYNEASHCERTDLIIQSTGSQITRHLREDDKRAIIEAIVRAIARAGYIPPALDPEPYHAPPKAPAHGYPEPGT